MWEEVDDCLLGSYRGDFIDRVFGVWGLDFGKVDSMVVWLVFILFVYVVVFLDFCENNFCLYGGICKVNGIMYGCSCD